MVDYLKNGHWSLVFPLCSQTQRHFSVFAVNFPSSEAQKTIFGQILDSHLKQQLFSAAVQKSAAAVVQAAISLHHKMTQGFLPTAVKFHYTFNLRDLTNIFQVNPVENFSFVSR